MGSILTYNGKVLTSGAKWVGLPVGPYNPLGLPPYTIRAVFPSGYDPHITVRGTLTQVSVEPNVWDVCTANESNPEDWHDLFNSGGLNVCLVTEILGANSYGVYSMHQLFANCPGLNTVPLFDTRTVTYMSGMFADTGLQTVPLFPTYRVTDMSTMFANSSIVHIPQFDTSSVTDMHSMFSNAYHFETMPLLDTSKVTNMWSMFDRCPSLTTVPLLDTHNVVYTGRMFWQCTSLETVPLFDTQSMYDIDEMFEGCVNVQSGALALYNQMSAQATPPTVHHQAFADCGSNTVSGAAELAQIPDDWK
jgi:hypothetical protein